MVSDGQQDEGIMHMLANTHKCQVNKVLTFYSQSI